MTQQQIEGNEIIAEFMGYQYYQHRDNYPGWRKEGSIIVPKKELSDKIGEKVFLGRTARSFRFHSSWDWLLPAVNKFINENFRLNEPFGVLKYKEHIRLRKNLHSLVNDFNITAVFNCLVEAIQWYNQNKQK